MDSKTIDYEKEQKAYFKILIALLVLTAITFIQPHIYHESTFASQMFIAVIKAWLIVMYYMHLKGEKLIGAMVIFALFLVSFFFIIIIGIDVPHFQFGDESYITMPHHVTDVGHATHAVHASH